MQNKLPKSLRDQKQPVGLLRVARTGFPVNPVLLGGGSSFKDILNKRHRKYL